MNKINIALSGQCDSKKQISIREDYINAVWREGGIASPLMQMLNENYISEVCRVFDGFIFCGGGDIDPKYYNQESLENAENICSLRDEFEYRLFIAVYKTGKPILGICRGMQIINVFLGGTLYQHIEGHMQSEQRNIKTHEVSLYDKTLLKSITKKSSMFVNSFHHQTINSLSQYLIPNAYSSDGYIEAFHGKDHPFLLGVEWHPEALYSIDSSAREIFRSFINACKKQNTHM